MDKFECLKVFSHVARLGSFTAAANELNTTQSAVSKKIAWLESEVGITLFHRHARAISLTSGGKQYLKLAQTLTEQMDSFESQLRQEQASVSGKLKLSVPSAFSVRLLSAPLNEFLNQHPELSVDVSVSDKFVDLVEGNVDIAIRAAYLKDSGLKARWLMDNELVYFASPNYLDKTKPIHTANDLSKHLCLTYSLSNPSNLWRFSDGNETIKVKVKEQVRSDSPEMLVQMAKLGQGIAAMPKWMVEQELNNGELIQVLTQYQSVKLPMYLVYKDSEYQPQRIRTFIDFLVKHFSQG
ncbi:LysR family transcriptional regulator [Vibrio campbellii]|uniref:LysR family transcriptional regulator n=1 Tax=Vibrio campbellii TaxID=680 RepID=UPI0006826C34|nr:LysR family transcriptional regulator [Vibrio campbellii]APX09215.1 LysR family transcriptional regulator [Vibrio campbellii]ARR08487.1 LysR family transcriptional regulator [Vibrio campbellii]MCC8254142.1 LysR family transcriptional regulator [Vibrio campbellii CAIM 333]HDM8216913.1 LysR family transcriptional regulator [Vibrio campbellii]